MRITIIMRMKIALQFLLHKADEYVSFVSIPIADVLAMDRITFDESLHCHLRALERNLCNCDIIEIGNRMSI